MTLRLLIAQLAGVFIVLGVAAWFVVYSVPRAEAAECRGISGMASYYGVESGNRTATGARFDGRSMTAAMPDRKHLGEHWRVTFRGKSVVVLINDIGPARRLHRVIDLSKAAAGRIGLGRTGVGRVCLERVG
jgi:rare lipoprotein A